MLGPLLAIAALLIIGYSLLARPIARWYLTYPMLSLLAGIIVFSFFNIDRIPYEEIKAIAEITLVVVLFHDASTVRIGRLEADRWLPSRLLLIGFPLALLTTLGVTMGLLPEIGLAGALLIAAAITPTDAGLGSATVLNPVVPARVRRALNVESGLNDGLATPVVLIALSVLAAEEGAETPTIFSVGVVPVTLAVVVGGSVAWLAARAVDWSRARGTSTTTGRMLIMLSMPVLLFSVAEIVEANAFIAAFVGGLVFGATSRTVAEQPQTAQLIEIAADLLAFVVWFLGGALVLVIFGNGFRWEWVVIAILALTVLRIVPVAVALIGTRLRAPTVAFIGWFGPRGLASIVFILLAVEELGTDDPVVLQMAGVVGVTVVISIVAHGASAAPLSRRYGAWAKRVHAPIEEEPGAHHIHSRGRALHGSRWDRSGDSANPRSDG